MKFSLILDNDELTVITEDGGIAFIREAEDISPDEPRTAVTDYYQMRLTDVPSSEVDNLFEHLAEGKMHCKDWDNAEYNSLEVIKDALDWLCVDHTNWELSDNLFPHFFGSEHLAKTNQAAREIERLNAALQQAVNERNEAWFQLEELQEGRDVTAGGKDGKAIVSG